MIPAALPVLFEAEMFEHARAALASARSAFEGGDPFADATVHAAARDMLRAIADAGERNCAYVVEMALAGFEDAHGALSEMIAERGDRGEPLGSALITYTNILSQRGAPRARPPEGRPDANFLANFVIVCMLIDLQQRFPGLKLRRSPASRRHSACSIVSAVLIEGGVSRGGEEAIRRIWEREGPPSIPLRRHPPPPGVVRFTNR